MSQTSVHSQSQQQQPSEQRSNSFHIPDGPPQPRPREEIAQLQAQHSNANSNSGSEHKPAVGPDEELSNEKAQELGLPEQKHAGKVGYGPEYLNNNVNHVSLSEKIQGMKEEVVGHIKKDPELVTRGKERKTGELKRKEHEQQENDSNPFADPEEHAESQSTQPADDVPRSQDPNQKKRADSSIADQKNPDSSRVKIVNGQTNINSDRRQVQEEQQAGKSRNVDLDPKAGRLNPNEHQDKGVQRAAEL